MADTNISGSLTPTTATTTQTTELETPITLTTKTTQESYLTNTGSTFTAAELIEKNESKRPSSAASSGNNSLDIIDDEPSSSSSSVSRNNKQTEDEMKSFKNENTRYGKCKWFNVAKGWGFITPNDGGQEVFVHQSVIQMTGFRSLGEQEEVEFEAKETERGLEATRVSGCNGVDCHGSTFHPRGAYSRTTTKKKRRRIRCYNCGEFSNHIAVKCEQGPQPKRCHLCKQTDHLYADCPSKKTQSS